MLVGALGLSAVAGVVGRAASAASPAGVGARRRRQLRRRRRPAGVREHRPARRAAGQPRPGVRPVRDPVPARLGGRRADPGDHRDPRRGRVPDRRADVARSPLVNYVGRHPLVDAAAGAAAGDPAATPSAAARLGPARPRRQPDRVSPRGGRARGRGRRPRSASGWRRDARAAGRRPRSPARSTTPCTNALPRATWSSPRRMPSSCSTNVSLGRGLDPPAAHGLGDAQGVAADDAHGDGVDDPVGVADDDGDEGVEARPQRQLLGRRDGAEQHLGSPSACCSAAIGSAASAVERAEPVGDGAGVGAEAADVLAHEVGERVADVRRPRTGRGRRARGRAPTAASRRWGSPSRRRSRRCSTARA